MEPRFRKLCFPKTFLPLIINYFNPHPFVRGPIFRTFAPMMSLLAILHNEPFHQMKITF